MQQRELLIRQFNAGSSPEYPPSKHVDVQIGNAQSLGLLRGALAQATPDTGKELGKGEGLDQVIVCPQLEASDTIRHIIQRRQKQYGCLGLGSNGLDDRPPVHTWQHDVQDDDVVVGLFRHVEPIATIVRDVDHETRLRQSLLQILRSTRFVFYNKYPHLSFLLQQATSIRPVLAMH